MVPDVECLLRSVAGLVGDGMRDDGAIGGIFERMMRSLVHLDHIVIFAYRGSERPIELYSTFDRQDHIVFVALYQDGPYLLDPFYRTATDGGTGLFRMRDLAPDRFFSSEYYRTYYVRTGLAEEIGFFVAAQRDVTLVLSLMRREESGPFPATDFTLLRHAEPLVAAMVRHHWAGIGRRFDAAKTGRPGASGGGSPLHASYALWRDLKLSARETGIVELVLQGYSSESIGLKLKIATGTVKVHRRNIYRKLGISSQTQLLSLYLKNLTAAAPA